ncbi:MAG: hypothetical protein C0614_10740 [Desulfuromonas sp.]|nr:MAG: hypothetical protein C0614_10740 [Desulfuromonas sp.]
MTMAKTMTSPPLAVSAPAAPLWLRQLVRSLIFIFPATVATLGWGSHVFALLLLPALYYGRGWSNLSIWERRLMVGFVTVFAVMALSLVNAEELREGVQALERYLRFALIVPIYLMFRRFGFSPGREFAAGALLACLAMGIQAFYQVEIQGLNIAFGAYHKIVFGDLAVWWGTVAATLAVTIARTPLARMGLGLTILAAIYASILSQTRGAWLFMPLVPAILFWAQWGRIKVRRAWVATGLVVLLLATLAAGSQSERVRDALSRGVSDLEQFARDPAEFSSLGTRLNLWRNSLLLLGETPLLGSGVGDFQADMQRMVDDGRSWAEGPAQYSHAHSIYFDTLAKGGLLGFTVSIATLLLLPLIVFRKALLRAREPWERFHAIGGIMMVAAFATFGLSEGLWSRNPFVNTYVISLVMFLAGAVNRRGAEPADGDPP